MNRMFDLAFIDWLFGGFGFGLIAKALRIW